MIWTIHRDQYLPECTLGQIEVAGRKFSTIEPPWTPHPVGRGGVEYRSCVPEGSYRVTPCVRPNGEKTFALSNPELDVYETPFEIPVQRRGIARSLIFLQAADYAHDLHGGIGAGLLRTRGRDAWLLQSSRDAMNQIRTLVSHTFDLALIIRGDHAQTAAA